MRKAGKGKEVGQGMDDIRRIYERFRDINDFAGLNPGRSYGWEVQEKMEDFEIDEKLMSLINEYLNVSVNEAFYDGFRFGMKFLMECVI